MHLAGNVTKDFAATAAVLESAGIKFPSTSGSGVTLRSQRMKLPPSVGQKKTKAIEQMLAEIDVEPAPIPTEVQLVNTHIPPLYNSSVACVTST